MGITVGARTTVERRVDADMTAERWGNTGVRVLATPHLVGLFEQTAVRAIQSELGPGESTVGTHVDIRHLKATPVGDTLRLEAEVTAVDGRRVTFWVRATDSGGLAGEGTHERVVIDLARFLQRVGALE